MKDLKDLPDVVVAAVMKRWPLEALQILETVKYDSLNGCWYFTRWGMYFGIESDGYIHT